MGLKATVDNQLSPVHLDHTITLCIQHSQAAKLEFGKSAYLWLDNSYGSTCVVSGVLEASCSILT